MIFDHQLKVGNSDLMSWLSEEFFPCTVHAAGKFDLTPSRVKF